MKKIFLLAIFITTNAFAGEVTLQGGWQHTPNSNYGDGVEPVVRIESKLYKDFNYGLEYAYHGNTSHDPYGEMSGHSVLGELLYYPSFNWLLKPYVVGGLGWSWWNFNRSSEMEVKQIEIEMGSSFAKKVGVGFDYPINNNWSLNVEWNYFQSHVPKDSFDKTTGQFANVVTDEKTIGQEETNIMLGLKYRF